MKMSEEVDELFTGMFKLKGKLKQPEFDGSVDYETKKGDRTKFEYATYKAVSEAIRTAAQDSASGIDFQQEVINEENIIKVLTIVTHSSGQYMIHGPFTFKHNGGNAQNVGSLTTYAKRYQLSAVFGIAGEKDDDAQSTALETEEIVPPSTRSELSQAQMTVAEKKLEELAEKNAVELSDVIEELTERLQFSIGQVEALSMGQYGILMNVINKELNRKSKPMKQSARDLFKDGGRNNGK